MNRHSGPTADDVTGGERETLDELFGVLSHPVRRYVLTALEERAPTGEEGDAPVALATDTLATDGAASRPTELYHVHLPKLDGAGYVEWDRDADAVRRGPRWDEVAPVLDLLSDNGDALPGGWP